MRRQIRRPGPFGSVSAVAPVAVVGTYVDGPESCPGKPRLQEPRSELQSDVRPGPVNLMCGRLHRGCRVGGSPDLCGLAGVIGVSVTPSVGPEPGDLER